MSRRLLPLLTALALATAACGEASDATTSADTAATTEAGTAEGGDGGAPSAVASSYPLAWIAGEVAPEAELTDLSRGGGDPHDFELSPSQREAMEAADVVLYLGAVDFMPQVEEAAADATGIVVDASEVAGEDRLLTGGEAHAHEGEGEDHAEDEEHADEGEDHADEEEHADEATPTEATNTSLETSTEGDEHADEGEAHADEGDDHADEGDDHAEEGDDHGGEGAVDPHMWFDPSIMADYAVATGEAFAEADPENADTYTENAAAVAEEMAALQGELDDLLGGDCTFDEAIVSHEAFGYLLEPYDKVEHGVTGVDAEAGATSGELAELVEEVEAEGLEHVLTDVLEGRAGAEALANEAGVELLEVNSLDVVDDEAAEIGYPDLARQQAEAFATALGCA